MNTSSAETTRTDSHIAELRHEIAQLGGEIASPLTSTPMRERLKQQVASLEATVDRHERARIVLIAV